MGLVMVCPQCQAYVPLQSQSCPYCQADLRNVPEDRRRYVTGEQPGPFTPPPEPVAAAIPAVEPARAPLVAASAADSGKIRRPHVRRFAAPPVSATQPAAKSAKTVEAKPEAKKAKKPKATSKKKK